MSVRVQADVWQTALPPNQRLVLLAYADHANDDGESIYPGEQIMRDKTSYSATSIRRITAELIDAQVLIRTAEGHKGQRANFRIDMAVLGTLVDDATKARNLRALTDRDTATTKAPNMGAFEPKASHQRTQSLPPADPKPPAGGTPNHQEPSLTTREELAAKPRKQNRSWDFLTDPDTFSMPSTTKAQQALVGKLAREMNAVLDHNAVPDASRHAALAQAAALWPLHFESATLTPQAFSKHLNQLLRPPLRGVTATTDAARHAIEDQELIDRLAANEPAKARRRL